MLTRTQKSGFTEGRLVEIAGQVQLTLRWAALCKVHFSVGDKLIL